MQLKLGSLFDGIGGFPLVAERYGIKPVWASEIEAFPIKVTKYHFSEMLHLGDICKINGAEIDSVDIITGGSPCQDLSVAGKRAGLEGDRSGLFMEMIRIIKEMRESTHGKYPRYVIWENVPGAFSSNKGEDFKAVLEEFCKIANTAAYVPQPDKGKWKTAGVIVGNGYSLAWRVFDAQYWGVPQRRRRIYLVADFGGYTAPEVLFEQQGLSGHSQTSSETGQGIAGGTERSIGKTISCATKQYSQNIGYDVAAPLMAEDYKEPQVICFEPGAASRLGGHTQEELCGTLRADTAGCNGKGWKEDVCYTLNTIDRPAVLPFNATQITSPQNGNNPQWNDPCHPLCATDYAPYVVIDRPAVYAIGNGQTNQSIDDKAGALNCMHDQQAIITGQNSSVRRLTPLECERLQGFPDGWTDIPGASDSARYKALGNSVAIPCVEHVIKNIKEAIYGHPTENQGV